MNDQERQVWLEAAGLVPKQPDKRFRPDNPERFLPDPAESRKLIKNPGRPPGATSGWTRAARNREIAQAKWEAKVIVDHYFRVGYMDFKEALEKAYAKGEYGPYPRKSTGKSASKYI